MKGYEDVTRWLSGIAPPVTDEQPTLHGRGRKFDIALLVATMTRAVSAAGGEVRVGCEVADVAKDGDGFTLSVRRDGETVTVRTRALVLATGGRQADPEVRSLVSGGEMVPPLRGNAFSRGDGARIASALGGRINTANKGFYGHLWAAGVEPLAPFDFVAFTFYQSEEGVMFDASGRRFAEETRGDHNNTMALAEHGGHALLLWSEEVQERAGGRPFVGGSLPMDRWGSRTTAAAASRRRRTRPSYSESRATGATASTARPGRRPRARAARHGAHLRRRRHPGGDDDVRRHRDGPVGTRGGTDGEPIAGLYPAGGDASDVYHRGYAGGLCGAVTGRGAGTIAARFASGAPSRGARDRVPPLAARGQSPLRGDRRHGPRRRVVGPVRHGPWRSGGRTARTCPRSSTARGTSTRCSPRCAGCRRPSASS